MKAVGEMIKKLWTVGLALASIFTVLSPLASEAANPISRLIISRSAVVASSGQAFSTQPIIITADSSNDPVRTAGNTITASITSGAGGSLVGTTTATTSNQGRATFDNLGLSGNPGVTYTIRYSYSSFNVSENITIPLSPALNPTFGTYTRTANGFTVAITNYSASYTWAGTATNGGSVSISDTGLATISGLNPGASSVATITTTRSGYNNGSSATTSTAALNAALTPAFSTYTQTSSGFTVQISNYSNSYTWAGTATNGGSVSISNSGLVTITGLSAGASSVATITTTRTGYVSGTADTASTAALLAALTPTFGTYTRTSTGFTVVITNYDTAYTWSGTATNSGTVSFSGTNGNGLATITGVASNKSSVATINTSRSGYQNGTANSASTSPLQAGLTPTTSSATSTFGGFTFNVTNYDSAYAFSASSTAGTATLGTVTGSTLPVTVTGLNSGQSATVTITTTRSSYGDASATRTGTSKTSSLTPSSGDPGAWNSSAISDNGQYVLFAGTKSKLFISPDNGVNWYASDSARSWTSVASSSNGQKMLAGVLGGKLYYSNDYGVSWSSKGSSRNWRAVTMSSDGSKLYGAVQNGFLYKSTNAGSSWTQLGTTQNWRAIATSQDGNILIAAAFGGNLYTSTNGGTTWTARDQLRNWSAVSISDDGTVMTATVANGGIYISTDSGATWNALPAIDNKNWNSISCNATCSRFVATNISGGLFVFNYANAAVTGVTNGSTTSKWSSVTLNSDGTQVIAGAISGAIRKSSDSGATWGQLTRIQQ